MSDAILSTDGRYRYALWRDVQLPLGAADKGTCLFVMLNPSTADAREDDPTIRRCIGFARSWSYGRLAVGNLYAYRATDPQQLGKASIPAARGPDNRYWIERLVGEADLVVAAWGASAPARLIPEQAILDAVRYAPAQCLGKTRGGYPRHPLYVAGDTDPEPWGRLLRLQ